MKYVTPSILLSLAISFQSAWAGDLPKPVGDTIPAKYSFVDPKGEVPKNLLAQALAYYDGHYSEIRNKSYMGVVDFSAYSGKARFYLIQMTSGAVSAVHVAHGMGSDPSHSGFAKTFANADGSNKSSLGVYMTAETYRGDHPGLSLRLDGLSPTNSNARARAVVIHQADYVSEADVNQGRSDGCLALAPATEPGVVSKLENGAVIYAGLSADK